MIIETTEIEHKFQNVLQKALEAKTNKIKDINVWQELLESTYELPNKFGNYAFHIIMNYMKEVFGNSFKAGLKLCNAGLTNFGEEFAKLGYKIMRKTCGNNPWEKKTLESYSQNFGLVYAKK